MDDQVNTLITKGAPLAGAAISLNWVKGAWGEKLAMFVSGSLLSYYTSSFMALKTGLPEGITGFGLGLFGMAICAKLYEVIQSLPIREIWNRILAWCGL